MVDGAEGAATNYNGQKLYEVAPDFALVGWLNMTALVYMQKAQFDALPENIQTALLESSHEAAVWAAPVCRGPGKAAASTIW